MRFFKFPVTPLLNSTVVATSSVLPPRATLPSYFWKPVVVKSPLRLTAPSEVKFAMFEYPSTVAVCEKSSVRSLFWPLFLPSTPFVNVADVPSNSIGPVSVTLPVKLRDGVVFGSCDRSRARTLPARLASPVTSTEPLPLKRSSLLLTMLPVSKTVSGVPLPISNSTDFVALRFPVLKLEMVMFPPPAVPPCVCVQRVSNRAAYVESSIVTLLRFMSPPKVETQPAIFV